MSAPMGDAFDRSIAELRALVASVDDETLASLGDAERRFVTDMRKHLAEYDRASPGEGAEREHDDDLDHEPTQAQRAWLAAHVPEETDDD